MTFARQAIIKLWLGVSEGRIISARQNRPQQKNRDRINRQIRAKEVRLIGADGHHIGVVSLREALEQARLAELDLVEVSPNANPPVCKVMDYGKFLYEKAKREREARKAQKQIEVKEIRLRPKTSEHHRSFKVRNARRWLEEGMKVKVRIRFRGREFHYPEIARDLLQGIAEELEDIGDVEQHPNMEGRTMLMVIGPKKGV
jgi:translation initiation factor IF-3